jgi:hypothetical protein
MSAPTIPTTPTPTPKKRRIWPYIAAIPVALFFGVVLGASSGQGATSSPAAAPVTVTVPAPAGAFADDARDNPAVPDPYLPNQQETVAPVPAGPLTTFSDGIYEIGTDDGPHW